MYAYERLGVLEALRISSCCITAVVNNYLGTYLPRVASKCDPDLHHRLACRSAGGSLANSEDLITRRAWTLGR